MNDVHCILLGKLSLNLLNPTTMYNILRNVSLHLPEFYELVAGTRAENVHLYYELVKVAVIGDEHCIILILNVLLKTANHYYVLHKIIALPARIFIINLLNTYLTYHISAKITFSATNVLFEEADSSYCSKSTITVCIKAVYTTVIKKIR